MLMLCQTTGLVLWHNASAARLPLLLEIYLVLFFAAYLQFLHPDFRNKLSQDLYGQM